MKLHHDTPRLIQLFTALQRCSKIEQNSKENKPFFTIEERWLINTERAAIYSEIAAQRGEIEPSEVKTYKVPNYIEEKIKEITNP